MTTRPHANGTPDPRDSGFETLLGEGGVPMKRSRVLAAEFRGTRTTLGVFYSKRGIDGPLKETTYPSWDFPDGLVQGRG